MEKIKYLGEESYISLYVGNCASLLKIELNYSTYTFDFELSIFRVEIMVRLWYYDFFNRNQNETPSVGNNERSKEGFNCIDKGKCDLIYGGYYCNENAGCYEPKPD